MNKFSNKKKIPTVESANLSNPREILLNSPLQKGEIDYLKQSILSTIVYYDCLDYPLTAVEIFRYFVILRTTDYGLRTIKLSDILEVLDKSEALKKTIEQKNGFYFLKGRGNIIKLRMWRKKLADEKWKKIKPILRLCRGVPYIRAIFVSGSLALGNVKKESDIDVLAVAKHGRIWTARALLTIFLSAAGKYRQTNSTADKVCANHYISDEHLTIPFPSLYNAQTYAHFFAADLESGLYLKKFKEANLWIKDYIPAFCPNEIKNMHTSKYITKNKISLATHLREVLELSLNNNVGDWLENKFRIFETNRVKKSALYAKPGGRITISDKQLEFHPASPEKIIVEKFNKKMIELGFKELANLKDSGLK